MKAIKEFIFYGNWFYGICAVALSIEASVQQFVPLNMPAYYGAIFIATIIYYSKAYIPVSDNAASDNLRSQWYLNHHKTTVFIQWVLSVLLVIICFYVGWELSENILTMPFWQWGLILIFPLVALWYYGLGYCFNLRNNGWTKPFVIGFVWAGVVTIYPVIFHSIQTHSSFNLNFRCIVLLFKNWMFIALLCILFDIKDYAIDANQSLITFVVKKGLRNTIFKIVIPLNIIGLIVFITYATTNHFPTGRILINTIPFISLLIVAYTLIFRKSILYYLIVVDGLMLLKAICGVVAIWLFK